MEKYIHLILGVNRKTEKINMIHAIDTAKEADKNPNLFLQ
jgi:hypothetical protein